MLLESKLKHIQRRSDRIVAQCPACAEADADKSGDHLVIFPDGKYGCVANPGDTTHRQRIWHLVGSTDGLKQIGSRGYINFRGKPAIKTLRTLNLTLLSQKKGADTTITDASDGCFPLGFKVELDPSTTQSPTLPPGRVVDPIAISKQPSEASDLIPEDFIETLATWTSLRRYPYWRDHPQLVAYDRKPKLVGWTQLGRPIYSDDPVLHTARAPRLPWWQRRR